MAVLTGPGIIFGDSTSMNSKYGLLPQGSVKLFFQANAPTGWTRSAAHNDKALRVVSGTGGGSGGVISFLTAFPAGGNRSFPATASISGSVNAVTIDGNTMGWHDHPQGFAGTGRHGWTPGGQGATATGAAGGSGAHAHPFSGSAVGDGSLDFRVQYIDVIICSLN